MTTYLTGEKSYKLNSQRRFHCQSVNTVQFHGKVSIQGLNSKFATLVDNITCDKRIRPKKIIKNTKR